MKSIDRLRSLLSSGFDSRRRSMGGVGRIMGGSRRRDDRYQKAPSNQFLAFFHRQSPSPSFWRAFTNSLDTRSSARSLTRCGRYALGAGASGEAWKTTRRPPRASRRPGGRDSVCRGGSVTDCRVLGSTSCCSATIFRFSERWPFQQSARPPLETDDRPRAAPWPSRWPRCVHLSFRNARQLR